MSIHSITVINDCQDPNAKARQQTRLAALFPGAHITFIGVTSDLEAAGNLLDTLDALDGRPGLILVNVAPRHGKGKKWENGTPFGHTQINGSHVFTTIDGVILGLLKKIRPDIWLDLYDIPTVAPHLTLSEEAEKRLSVTQFRSFEFLPRVAHAILAGIEIPSEPFTDIQDVPDSIWWIDCFGNTKTTLFADDIGFAPGKEYVLERDGVKITLPAYAHLKDVPNDVLALIEGSSGFEGHRLIEIVIQGVNVAEKLDFSLGDKIKINLA